MFSRMLQLSAALAVGVVLLATGRADATTVQPISPGNTYALNPDTFYFDSFINLPGSTTQTDNYKFDYEPPPAFGAAFNSTTTIQLGPVGFSSFVLDWLKPDSTSAIGGPISLVPGPGFVLNFPFPVSLAGTYTLHIVWQTFAQNGAGYQVQLLTPFAEREGGQLPLPPALLLFGSALVGLGALARRKRQAAKV